MYKKSLFFNGKAVYDYVYNKTHSDTVAITTIPKQCNLEYIRGVNI